MGFERFVEVGRVVMITYGPDYGKLAVIVEIIDHQRVLVEGLKVTRQAISFKRATLTSLKLRIPRTIGSTALLKEIVAQDLEVKWAQTSWAKKIEKRVVRSLLSDFDRFKVMLARKKSSTVIGKQFKKLRNKNN